MLIIIIGLSNSTDALGERWKLCIQIRHKSKMTTAGQSIEKAHNKNRSVSPSIDRSSAKIVVLVSKIGDRRFRPSALQNAFFPRITLYIALIK